MLLKNRDLRSPNGRVFLPTHLGLPIQRLPIKGQAGTFHACGLPPPHMFCSGKPAGDERAEMPQSEQLEKQNTCRALWGKGWFTYSWHELFSVGSVRQLAKPQHDHCRNLVRPPILLPCCQRHVLIVSWIWVKIKPLGVRRF